MLLTDDEKRMLEGEFGSGIQKAMELLYALGKVFEADKLIPITRAHVALSGQRVIPTGVVCLSMVVLCTVAPTANPAWMQNLTKRFNVTPDELNLAIRTVEVYRKIGAKLTFCCTPGLGTNVPCYGEHVAFSESSATPYVNSVFGARSNRESSVSALAAAVVGRTPLYGLHLDENRRGDFLVIVDASLQEPYDWGLLGWYIGRFAGTKIPVVRLRGMNCRPSPEELLYFGAELNTSGAVPMYHIEGITPEILMQPNIFKGKNPEFELVVTDKELRDQEEILSELTGPINLVMLGCPHYTYEQIRQVEELFRGRHVKEGVAFWILTSFDVLELASRSGRERLRKARLTWLLIPALMNLVGNLLKGDWHDRLA